MSNLEIAEEVNVLSSSLILEIGLELDFSILSIISVVTAAAAGVAVAVAVIVVVVFFIDLGFDYFLSAWVSSKTVIS